jgi:hypothetical protein
MDYELEDRKRLNEVIAKSGKIYYARLSKKNTTDKRWCISYYYYITDENKQMDNMTAINNINNSIAQTLKAMNLHIKKYQIKASVWNRYSNHSDKLTDVAISGEA